MVRLPLDNLKINVLLGGSATRKCRELGNRYMHSSGSIVNRVVEGELGGGGGAQERNGTEQQCCVETLGVR